MDPKRCTDHHFFIDPPIHHREILLSCLNVMKERLKKNICNLDDHVLLSEVRDLPELRMTYIGDTLGYACHFWTNHLMGIPAIVQGLRKYRKQLMNSSQCTCCFGLRSSASWETLMSVFIPSTIYSNGTHR
jgi:hypothetical protein